MSPEDMRKKSNLQLRKHTDKLRSELAELSRERVIKPAEDQHAAKKLRREIARTETIIKEQEKEES